MIEEVSEIRFINKTGMRILLETEIKIKDIHARKAPDFRDLSLAVIYDAQDQAREMIRNGFDPEDKVSGVYVLRLLERDAAQIGEPPRKPRHKNGCNGALDHKRWHTEEIYREINRRAWLSENHTKTGRSRANLVSNGFPDSDDEYEQMYFCPEFVLEVLKQETSDVRESVAKFNMETEFRDLYYKRGYDNGWLDQESGGEYDDTYK